MNILFQNFTDLFIVNINANAVGMYGKLQLFLRVGGW